MTGEGAGNGGVVVFFGGVAGDDDDVQRGAFAGGQLAEAFAHQPLDAVALVCAADLPLGDDQSQPRCAVLQTTTPQNGKTAVAAFAFRGLKYVVEVGALRQSRRAGK